MNLCKYSKKFGEPKKSFHRYRFFNLAIVDVIGTFFIALALYILLKLFNINVKYGFVLLFTFLLGIVMHRLFCVRTTIDKLLFS